MTSHILEAPERGITLEVLEEGEGPDVVLVPSAMRSATDFAHLQAALATAGYRSLALNPRNAGRSAGSLENLTLREIADDIALVVERLCDGPAHLVGHALGNVCVRAAASFRPDIARSVTVMPGGGHDLKDRPIAPEVIAAMPRCHDPKLSDAERIGAMNTAFFAPGNDASVWLTDWWPKSAGIAQAIGRTDAELWWRGGEVPMLFIMPRNDAMMDLSAGRRAAALFGNRATYVEIDNCGHAILPEQPDAIAMHLIAFLDRLEGRR